MPNKTLLSESLALRKARRYVCKGENYIMTKFYLETTGMLVEFSPKHLTMTTYVRNEIEQILIMQNVDNLRVEYRELLDSGYKKCDAYKVMDMEPILETPLGKEVRMQSEIEEMHQAEIEAIEREEFFTAKPDDWAYK